ncbi:MAG: hypothetical protein D6770_01895 [Anaerolineae bacterium]|nr:MAG: hypothetical protein D6770_01895 [Anaerolineae bacterium]
MSLPRVPVLLIVILLALLTFACNMPRQTPPPPVTIIVATLPSQGGAQPPPPPSTPVPGNVAAPQSTPIPHAMQPGEPPSTNYRMWDASSGRTASQGQTNYAQDGDYYDGNLYERPFNAQTQTEYYPDIDIGYGYLARDATWFYTTIDLYGLRPGASSPQGSYGVELDLNKDGRGDYLIWAVGPVTSQQWVVDGVTVYHDTNYDVGAARACQPDAPYNGNSYDQILFQSGVGSDPDAAWVRWLPGNPPRVQIAFKRSVIGDDGDFIWGVWAENGGGSPQRMDYNDQYTLSEAGAPYKGSRYFPIKSIAAVDNTCRWVFGFQPTGKEPCLCAIEKTPTPAPTTCTEPKKKAGCDLSGGVWLCSSNQPNCWEECTWDSSACTWACNTRCEVPETPPPPTVCTASGDPGLCDTAWLLDFSTGDYICPPAQGSYGWQTVCSWSTDLCSWFCTDSCQEDSGPPPYSCSDPDGWVWNPNKDRWECRAEEHFFRFDTGLCTWVTAGG